MHRIAHVAHIELRTSVLEESVAFHTHGTPPVIPASEGTK